MIGAAAIAGARRRGGGGVSDPTLIIDYDFTASTSLPSGFTFTSVAGGTYYNSSGVQQTASANEPRFDHHPTTLVPLGLRFDATPLDTALRSLTGTGFNGSTFTFIIDYMLPNGVNGNLGRIAALDNGTADGTDRTVQFYTNSALPQPNYNMVPQYRPAGATQFTDTTGAVTNGVPDVLQRVGMAVASNDVAWAQNGTIPASGTGTTATVPLAATTLRIGNLTAANRPFVGWVRRVRVYDVRKSNTDLATLTTVP